MNISDILPKNNPVFLFFPPKNSAEEGFRYDTVIFLYLKKRFATPPVIS